MYGQALTFVNNGYMGITVINGNNYGTVTGVTINGNPATGAHVDGVVYNNGANLNYQAGVAVFYR